jgi:hypothetical protein
MAASFGRDGDPGHASRLGRLAGLDPESGDAHREALDRLDTAEVTSNAERLGDQYTRMHGTPFVMRRRILTSPSRFPCSKPPFGALVAIDLKTGAKLWEVPLGDMRALAGIARDLGVGEHILLGQGEKLTNGADKSSILADTMEALFGATYLVHGIETARRLVMRLVGPLLEDAEALGAGTDWKTSIQELAAARKLGSVEYSVRGSGPDHARTFEATLLIGGVPYGAGAGHSKKEAEQEAASMTWRQLRAERPVGG